jgi:hypothetical protein
MTTGLVSHWEAGTWEPGERRLHWYLLPDSVPERVTDAISSRLDVPGFDVVPTQWLHCTVVSLLPSLAAADCTAVDHMVTAVRAGIGHCGRITARATLQPMSSALVWLLEPPHAFQEVFDLVVGASDSMLRTNRTRTYEPHLSVAYSSAAHDPEEVDAILGDATCALESVHFSHLSLLDVYQRDRCYQWDVIEEIPLAGPTFC